MEAKLIVSASPHFHAPETTRGLMFNVIVALMPTVIASAIIFGWQTLLVTAVTVGACVFFEWGWCKLMKKPSPIADLSAVVTGIILAMNLPSPDPASASSVLFSLFMAVIGAMEGSPAEDGWISLERSDCIASCKNLGLDISRRELQSFAEFASESLRVKATRILLKPKKP